MIKSSMFPISTLLYFTFNGFDGNVISSTYNKILVLIYYIY